MARKCKQCESEIPTVKNCDTFFEAKGYCDEGCMAIHGLSKFKVAKEKRERKELKARKEGLKTRGDHAKDAQVEFNKFIRARDAGQACISCAKPPKKKNAGHYRSVGAAPELRYVELNCHLQCEHCNTHLSSNAIEYRINLVKKIGQEKVEWLEGPHQPAKYTIEQLKGIKLTYRAKWKALEVLANDIGC